MNRNRFLFMQIQTLSEHAPSQVERNNLLILYAKKVTEDPRGTN